LQEKEIIKLIDDKISKIKNEKNNIIKEEILFDLNNSRAGKRHFIQGVNGYEII
jgi:hypothetical protein